MPAARYVTPDEGWNQNKTRAVALFFDQHRSKDYPDGRPWWGYTETPTDPTHPRGVVGELQPVVASMDLGDGGRIKGWDAPWLPEAKYVQMAVGLMAGSRFKIDYARMMSDYREANERYYTLAAQTAGARNWPAPKLYGPVDFQLRAIVGEPPKSPKIPEAALAGDPWLLGFDHRPNERLKKVLDREQGRIAQILTEASEDEQTIAQPQPRTEIDALAGLSSDDIAQLKALLAQRQKQSEQMANARAAKANKQDSHSTPAAA